VDWAHINVREEEYESNRQSLEVALAILDLELTAIYEHYKNSDELSR
jgi:hypothetical protein